MSGGYVEIGGHPTWIDHRGSGQAPILVLHGGMSDGELLLDGWEPSLGATHPLIAFDRRGHGRTADTDAPFHYDDMTTEAIGVLESVVGEPAHLVGWSDGGIVALAVALRRPDLVRRLVLIGTNFHYEGALQVDFAPDDAAMTLIMGRYATLSPDGGEHFPVAAGKFMQMSTTEPTWTTDDLADIHAPTLVVVGDDDLIALDHTCALYQALPQGQLAVVPGASHTVPIERADETAALIGRFLAAELPPTTMMAVRRR